MDVIAYVGLSHQMALRRQMDVIAGNIANASTSGYQREMVQFETFTEEMEGTELKSAAPVAFVLDHGIARDTTPGELNSTGNPLDVGIVGQGYFPVQGKDGSTLYTRAGHFMQDNEGYLATPSGERVLGQGGQTMRLQPEDRDVSIAGDGTVRSNVREIGRLAVVRFPEALTLDRAGNNLMRADENARPEPVREVKVRSGMLEQSNVRPIVEITQMISVQRAYEQTARMIDRMEEMRKKGTSQLARAQ